MNGCTLSPATELSTTIDPPPAAIRCGAAARTGVPRARHVDVHRDLVIGPGELIPRPGQAHPGVGHHHVEATGTLPNTSAMVDDEARRRPWPIGHRTPGRMAERPIPGGRAAGDHRQMPGRSGSEVLAPPTARRVARRSS